MELLFVIGILIALFFCIKNVAEKGLELFKKKQPFVYLVPNISRNKSQVTPDNTPLHIRRGWKQKGNRFTGYYRTRFGAWKGIIEKRGDVFKVYIFNPPTAQLKRHSRWICFHNKGNGKWKISLAINPKDRDVGAIIHYVETLIIKCFQ